MLVQNLVVLDVRLDLHSALHCPDGGREGAEPFQVTAQAWSVSAARRVDRFVGRSREPGQPYQQERFFFQLPSAVGLAGERCPAGGLCLGDDRVRCLTHLGGDLPGEHRAGFAAR